MKGDGKNDRAAWIQGPSAHCAIQPGERSHAWRLVLLGAPGVGKGTQAEMLCTRLGACHLSTGDIFRAAAGSCGGGRSPAMEAALQYMRRGQLVPDSTVWEIIRERTGCIRCHGGFVLDGFPRTLPQAHAFHDLMSEKGLPLDAVLNYELPFPEIIARLGGRRVCGKCKAVFHETQNPPTVKGVCDKCGGNLVQREDDRPESVEVRLEAYERETAPLIEFYSGLNLLVRIGAVGTPQQIYDRSLNLLEAAITDGMLRSRDPHDGIYGLGGPRNDLPGFAEPL